MLKYEFCAKKSRWTGVCTCVGGHAQGVPKKERLQMVFDC